MDGIIYKILVSAKNELEYGFIKNIQGEQFYFDGRFLLDGKKMADFYEGDHVEFSAITHEDGKKSAYNIVYVEPESDYVPTPESTGGDKVTKKLKEFYTPGYYYSRIRT